jgi:hypothetical protein
MKASDLVCSVRTRLGASADELDTGVFLELINAAMCEHAQLRPELYTVYKTVKLAKGSVQTADCCSLVLGVDMITSEDGTQEYGQVRKANSGAASLFASRCTSKIVGGKPIPTSASTDPNMPGQFKVMPPVQDGQDLWARVSCVETPSAITDINSDVAINCKNFEDLITYVMSKTYVPGDAEQNGYAKANQDYFYKSNNLKRQIGYQIMGAMK